MAPTLTRPSASTQATAVVPAVASAAGAPGPHAAGYSLQDVGLRVLQVLTVAGPGDVATAIRGLWHHVHGLSGAAPAEELLEGMAATMTTAVCAGGQAAVPIQCDSLHSKTTAHIGPTASWLSLPVVCCAEYNEARKL